MRYYIDLPASEDTRRDWNRVVDSVRRHEPLVFADAVRRVATPASCRWDAPVAGYLQIGDRLSPVISKDDHDLALSAQDAKVDVANDVLSWSDFLLKCIGDGTDADSQGARRALLAAKAVLSG